MLELKNISFTAKGGSRTKILDQVSLTIKPHTLTVITGPNGSGKSTLAEIIMGIKTPTKGSIVFNQKNITKLTITERANLGLAYAFQQPVHLKGIDTYSLLSIASRELIDPGLASKYLSQVGLDPTYLSREIDSKLSGGELKRIEIASVLARNAKLIIFDEPEAGIDLWSFNHLIKIFKQLKTNHVTIIIISHQEKILKLADNIIMLDNGRITQQGSPTDLLPTLIGGAHAAQ